MRKKLLEDQEHITVTDEIFKPSKSEDNPESLNSLLPTKHSKLPVIFPLIFIALALVFAGGVYINFVQPYHSEQQAIKETSQTILDSIVGYTVEEKSVTTDCYELVALSPDKKTRTTVCVTEKIWNANSVGELFTQQ